MAEKSIPQGGQPSQSSGADKSQQSAARAETPRSLKDTTKLTDLTISELAALVSAEVSRAVSRIGVGASHVNSGPPGFVNGGGHANFDPRVTIPASDISQIAGSAASHVNSGPPGFVNGGGHANFDPSMPQPSEKVVITLPDKTSVTVPATGPLNFRIGGFHITR